VDGFDRMKGKIVIYEDSRDDRIDKKRKKREICMTDTRLLDNAEEYDNPILYDLENDAYIGEVPFLSRMGFKKSRWYYH